MLKRKEFWLLLVVALTTYLIGNERVSLWDRDEPRYAQTSRQMLQSGDWVVPRLYDAVRTAKPVLIYWCQASCMKIFGETAMAARLPSAIAMTITLAVLAIAIGGHRGLLTSFILGTSVMVFWSAKSALTDSVLLLFVTATQCCVYAIWRGNRSWLVVVMLAVALGLGGLTKGPVVVAVPGVTLIALWVLSADRSVALRADRYAIGRWVVGFLIVAMIVAPWLILVEHQAPGYLRAAIGKEVIERARNPQEGHAGPPGYYLITIWAMYFPWSLLLPAAIICGWRRRHLPQIRFALAAIIGPWIMLEIVRTKLPHYLLPAYPFLAFLTADLLVQAARGVNREFKSVAFKWVVTGWSIVVVLLALALWLPLKWFHVSTNEIIGLVAFSIIAIEYARQVRRTFVAENAMLGATVMGAGMFVLVVVLHVLVLPQASFLQVSRQTAAMLPRGGFDGRAIMIDYKEPSLAFYQGGTIREEPRNDYLSTVLPLLWPRWIVVTRELWEKTPAERQRLLDVVGEVRGMDVASNKIVNVMVLRNPGM